VKHDSSSFLLILEQPDLLRVSSRQLKRSATDSVTYQ